MSAKSEAKNLETDVVIFPMNFGHTAPPEMVSNDVAEKIKMNEKSSIEIENESRFARLRKSLRKRSVSIL